MDHPEHTNTSLLRVRPVVHNDINSYFYRGNYLGRRHAFFLLFTGHDAQQFNQWKDLVNRTNLVGIGDIGKIDVDKIDVDKIIDRAAKSLVKSARKSLGKSIETKYECPKDYPEEQAGLCYKPCKRNVWAFVRGVGPICWGCPSSHPSEEGSLCYRRCPSDKPYKSTYHCFGDCPGNYRNDGLTCFRDAHIFGSDNSRCPWYDKCGLTFHRGCSKCPSGYTNDGCTCRRNPHAILRPSYIRGVGIALRSYSRGVGKLKTFYFDL